MILSAIAPPRIDPSPIFEICRGNHGTELLMAAVAHLGVFARLAEGARSFDDLREAIGLAERPARVLVTALRAFGLVIEDGQGRLGLSDPAREPFVPSGAFDVSGYIGMAADRAGVVEMVSGSAPAVRPARSPRKRGRRSSTARGSSRPWSERPRPVI